MKLNTIIKLPDGRIGTICWRHLDGEGGVWGEHHFEMPIGGFSDDLPNPEFMLREKITKSGYDLEKSLRESHGSNNLECVGGIYEIINA